MTIENKISLLREDFGREFDSIKHFEIFSHASQFLTLMLLLEVHEENKENIRDYIIKKYPDIPETIGELEKTLKLIGNRDGYTNHLIIKSFIDRYRIFEEYTFRFFYTIGSEFPNILFNKREKIEISIIDINNLKNQNDFIETITQHEIHQIFFSGNLVQAIQKLKKVFSLNFEFSKKDEDFITIISVLRNLIIHNGGKMNRISETKLKKLGYSLPIKLDEPVTKYIKENEIQLMSKLGDFIVNLHENILKNLERLKKHNKGLAK